ncbi:MAG: hypothetical protein ACYC3X_21495, partial [Pirellulaceae bacterium]
MVHGRLPFHQFEALLAAQLFEYFTQLSANPSKQYLARRKRRILARLDKTKFKDAGPVLSGANIHYEVAERTHGIACGDIGMIQDMVQRLGLVQVINRPVPVLKRYLPYSESDHVLNIAYNVLAGGTCLDHLELRR